MCRLVLTRAWAALLIGIPAAQADVPLRRLAGSGDPMPGAPPGMVFHELAFPQVAGSWVVAGGYSGNERQGLYAWDGSQFWVVADDDVALPGAGPSDRFSLWHDVGNWDVGPGGLVAFTAVALQVQGGLWAWRPGLGLTEIAVTPEVIPGMEDPLVGFSHPVVGGESVFFVGSFGSPPYFEEAILRWDAQGLVVFFDPPDGSVGALRATNDRLWFLQGQPAQGSQETEMWSCRFDGSDLRLEFDFDTSYPGLPGSGWFETGRYVPEPAVFRSSPWPDHPGLHGLFHILTPTSVEAWLDQDDPEPSGGVWDRFGPHLAGSGERVVFSLHDPVPQSSVSDYRLYVRDGDGSFRFILATATILEGQFVGIIDILPGSMDGDTLAMGILRSNDSAVWLADLGAPSPPVALEIPTSGPTAAAVLAFLLGVAGLGSLLKKRRCART